MKTRRAAVYLRVSTGGQSFASQKRVVMEFLRRRGWQIFQIYAEKKSGAAATRPALDQLLQDARHHRFDALVTYKLDRIGRSGLHLAQIAEEFARLRIGIVTATEGIDTSEDNPMGRFVLDILAAVGRLERERIRERVVAGVGAAKARGVKFGRPKIAAAVKARILELAAERSKYNPAKPAHSRRHIASLAGVSLGTVANVIAENKNMPPDVRAAAAKRKP